MRGTIPERHQLNEVLLELQKMKTRFANLERNGEITDVKYDKDQKRWYAKYKEESFDPDKPFISDWRPWKSFAHGSISASIPPRIGQKATLSSPGGYPEQAYIEPYHYGPDTPSPHDKQDEVVFQIQKPKETQKSQDGQETTTGGPNTPNDDDSPTLRVHAKNDAFVVTLGRVGSSQDASASNGDGSDGKTGSTFQMTLARDGKTITCGKFKAVIGKDGAKLTWGDQVSFELKDGQIESVVDGAKHTLTKDSIKALLGSTTHTLTDGLFHVEGGSVKHDDRNIGAGHVHSGVFPGAGKTQQPDP